MNEPASALTGAERWIESAIEVGDRAVGLCVERLEPAAKDRAAAVLAWLTMETLTSPDDGGAAAWHEFVGEMLRQHVMFSVADETEPQRLDVEWWTEVMGRAFIQFVRQNELGPRVHRHMEALSLRSAAVREV